MGRFASIAFTPRVKAEQERMGSRRAYARADGSNAPDVIGEGTTEGGEGGRAATGAQG